MKQLVVSFGGPDVKTVFQRIKDIASGKVKTKTLTCWNQVGNYLLEHPDTEGYVLFFGDDDPEYVYHAVIVDKHNRLLKDALGTKGKLAADYKTYHTFHSPNNPEVMNLISKQPVSPTK